MQVRGTHSRRYCSWLAALAILISLCFKLASLHSRELWLDEFYSAHVAHLPLAGVLRFTAGDDHPPLFLLLLRAWVRLAGDTMARLRLFTVLFNILAMTSMLVVAQRILGPRFGSYAAAMFAFSPILFVYSLEVRNYMLWILVFILLLGLHWRVIVEREDSSWWVAAYGGFAALLFYVHYLAAFALFGLAIHIFCSPAYWRGRLRRIAAAAGLCFLLVAPHVPQLLAKRQVVVAMNHAQEAGYQNPDSIGYLGSAPPEPSKLSVHVKSVAVLAGFFPARSHGLLLLCAVPLLTAGIVLLFLAARRRDPLCLLCCIEIAVIEVGVTAIHLDTTKYALLIVPVCVLALARAMQYACGIARWQRWGIACSVGLLAVYCAGFYRQFRLPQRHPWNSVFTAVERNYQPGDAVVFDSLYAQVPFDYFGRHRNFHPLEMGFPISEYDWWDEQPCKAWGGPVITHGDLNRFVDRVLDLQPHTIWVVLYETYYYDPNGALVDRLGRLGRVTQVQLPADRSGATPPDSAPRLLRIDLPARQQS